MASRASLRASDSEREQTVERLRQAAAEGRLLAEELEQRIGLALRARTYGELDAILADLPGPAPARRSTRTLPLARPVLALAIAIPVLLAVLAAAAFVLTGMLAVLVAAAFAIAGTLAPLIVWVAIGCWFFGHRRGVCRGFHGRCTRSARPQTGRPGSPAGRGSWI
ncbi:MAG: DUF1707 SHOCT-like domain-containing protein [Solirubrobacteraceae bacterium]